MKKMQEQPRVLAHRAGNIEQRHDRRLAGLGARDISDRSPPRPPSCWSATYGADRSGGRDARLSAAASSPRRAAAPVSAIACLASAISAADICAKSFFSSTSRSDTVSRASISTSFFSCGTCFSFLNMASSTRLAAGGGGALSGCCTHLRQHHRHQLVEIGALAEEDPERLVEQDRMLVPLHEHRMQRPVEVVARADAGDAPEPRSASITEPGPTGMPAARSARAK